MLTFGGFFFVAGGSFHLIGSTIFRYRPYGNPNPEELSFGRDVLVVAGQARMIGVVYISVQLWHIKLTAGGVFGVAGGSLETYGTGLVTITGLNNQFGAGLQTFVGKSLIFAAGLPTYTAQLIHVSTILFLLVPHPPVLLFPRKLFPSLFFPLAFGFSSFLSS